LSLVHTYSDIDIYTFMHIAIVSMLSMAIVDVEILGVGTFRG